MRGSGLVRYNQQRLISRYIVCDKFDTQEIDHSLTYQEAVRETKEKLQARSGLSVEEKFERGIYNGNTVLSDLERWYNERDPSGVHPDINFRRLATGCQMDFLKEWTRLRSTRHASVALGISYSAGKKRFAALRRKGYVESIGYNICSPVDISGLQDFIATPNREVGPYPEQHRFDIHDFRVKFPLHSTTIFSKDMIKRRFKIVGKRKCWLKAEQRELSKNNPYCYLQDKELNFSIRLTTKSLIVWVKGIVGNDLCDMVNRLQDKAADVAARVEQDFNIIVLKDSRTDATITSLHTAYINDSLWDLLKGYGWSGTEYNGRIRLVLDHSNAKHIESHNPLTSDEDIEAISQLMRDTVERGLYPSRLVAMIDDLRQQNMELSRRIGILEQSRGKVG